MDAANAHRASRTRPSESRARGTGRAGSRRRRVEPARGGTFRGSRTRLPPTIGNHAPLHHGALLFCAALRSHGVAEPWRLVRRVRTFVRGNRRDRNSAHADLAALFAPADWTGH